MKKKKNLLKTKRVELKKLKTKRKSIYLKKNQKKNQKKKRIKKKINQKLKKF